MRKIISNLALNMKNSFKLVEGNARACLVTQPLWSFTSNLFVPYMTLYMLAIGCTNEQVGQINAIGMIAGTVFAVFAGWITDRLGRRRANALGDLVCWASACLLWALSSNMMWFIVAAVANSFSRISGVAWNCSLNESMTSEKRVNVFFWLSIVTTVSAFVTPLMNLLIQPFGLVKAMRIVLFASSAVLVVAVFLRYSMMRELPVGVERMRIASKQSPFEALKSYRPIIKNIFTNKVLLLCILLRTLYYVQISFKRTYEPITVVNGLGFTDKIIGTLNLITGIVMLMTQFLLLPKLRSLSSEKTMVISFLAQAVSMVILVFAPVNSIFLLVLSTVLFAAGSVVSSVLVDTLMGNAMPDMERAQMMSFVTVLSVAISAPFMWLGGIISGIPNVGPRLPMAMIVVLLITCVILLKVADKLRKNTRVKVLNQQFDYN